MATKEMATKEEQKVYRRKVYQAEAERTTKLTELGLTEKDLRDAASFGVVEASRCTENDPRTARGWIRWAKTIRALRETLTSRGWNRRESRNYPTVVNPENTIAITASSGDENVGTGREPQTTRAKGEATKKAVIRNQSSFADIDPDFPADPEDEVDPDHTWLLLYHEDEEAGETRLELSLPTRMEADGHVTGWSEQILLDPISNQPGPIATAEEESEPPIDVPVERRAN